MFAIWRVVVSALALCTPRTLRAVVEQTVTSLSLPGIAERGHNSINGGYAALVTTLHVSGVALSGRSPRHLEAGLSAPMLYEVCSGDWSSNATGYEDCAGESQPVFTVLPYNGTKALSVYYDQRALSTLDNDRSRALAVYDRPRALVVYTHPTDYVRLGFFWVDPRPYQVVACVYRRLFRDDGLLFKEYAHLDRRLFIYLAIDIEDLITMLVTTPGREPQTYLTIGKLQPRFEERAGCLLASFYELGFYISLASMALRMLVRQPRARTSRYAILLLEHALYQVFGTLLPVPIVPISEVESESADTEPEEESEIDETPTTPSSRITPQALEVAALANVLATTEPTGNEPTCLPDTVSLGNLASTGSVPPTPAPVLRMRSCSYNDRPRARAAARRVRCTSFGHDPELVGEPRAVVAITPLSAPGPIRVRSASHNGSSGIYAVPATRERCVSSSGRLLWCHQVTRMDHEPDIPATEGMLIEVPPTEEVPKIMANPPKPKRIRVFEATDKRPDVVERQRAMEIRLQSSSTPQPSWVFQAERGWVGQDERRRKARRYRR